VNFVSQSVSQHCMSIIEQANDSTGQNHSPQAESAEVTKLFSVCRKSQGSLRGSRQTATGCYLKTEPQTRTVLNYIKI